MIWNKNFIIKHLISFENAEIDTTTINDIDFTNFSKICQQKVQYLKKNWSNDPCYSKYFANGNLESIYRYLTEVEKDCPEIEQTETKLNWVDNNSKRIKNAKNANLQDIMKRLDKEIFIFTKERIQTLWSEWERAGKLFHQSSPKLNRRKIIFIVGIFIVEKSLKFVENALKGGPLGELVQWSDLITAAILIGYDVEIISEFQQLKRFFGKKGICSIANMQYFDEIYIDYISLGFVRDTIGLIFLDDPLNCKLRIIDSFGSEPQFIAKSYTPNTFPRVNKNYLGYGTHPKQIYTMFPHTPDNTFIGFSIDDPKEVDVSKKENIVLVYGKNVDMWKKSFIKDYLQIFVDHGYQVHGTINKIDSDIPSFVINHGVLSHTALVELLKKAKMFVGLGFPYEGPAPLEAISYGCVFINYKHDQPHGPHNDQFFRNKPTTRNLSSQNPYMEDFVGEPYVYTVNVNNREEIINVLEKIKNHDFKPYLPHEFTKLGLLERFSHLTQNSNYCKSSKAQTLFDPSKMSIEVANPNESCWIHCVNKKMICESTFLSETNLHASSNIKQCAHPISSNELYSSPQFSDNLCYLQYDPKKFSCGSIPLNKFRRICPCRLYNNNNSAL